MKLRLLLFFMLGMQSLNAQQDSAFTLSPERFLQQVKQFHPIAQKAGLAPAKTAAFRQRAYGAFDPVLKSIYENKTYGGKDYYGIFDAGLTVPAWYGLEAKAGFQSNQGMYLNPEDMIPSSGLWYAGISAQIGQGLFYDARRAGIASAKMYESLNEAERQSLLNNLVFDASKAYYDWSQSLAELEVAREGLELASERLRGVKLSIDHGDRAAIDSVEAGIQVQNFQLNVQQALLKAKNARLMASVFLWGPDTQPLEIDSNARAVLPADFTLPDITWNDSLENRVSNSLASHPDLQSIRGNIGMMQVETKLKAEKIKPKLAVSWNILQQHSGQNPFAGMTPENYKAAITFSSPLLIREARGDLKLAKLKIQEYEFGLDQKSLEQEAKIRAYANEILTLRTQVFQYRKTVQDYYTLLKAERQNFLAGESSMFLVNTREQNYLNAKLKLIELETKIQKSVAGMKWACGEAWQ